MMARAAQQIQEKNEQLAQYAHSVEKRDADMRHMKELVVAQQAREAERLRFDRAARRIQKQWRRHKFRGMVKQVIQTQREAREKEQVRVWVTGVWVRTVFG